MLHINSFIVLQAATVVDHLCHKADAKLLEDDLKSLKKFPIKQQQHMQRIDTFDNESSTEIKVKIEKLESAESTEIEEQRSKKHSIVEDIGEMTEPQPPLKVWKGSRYKIWAMDTKHHGTTKGFKKPTDKEITEVNDQFCYLMIYLEVLYE